MSNHNIETRSPLPVCVKAWGVLQFYVSIKVPSLDISDRDIDMSNVGAPLFAHHGRGLKRSNPSGTTVPGTTACTAL